MSKHTIILFDIDYTLYDTEVFKTSNLQKHALYKEVQDVLQKLAKIATLGIFSQGDLELQTMKLHKTNIVEHFSSSDIHIVEEKEKTLRQILKKYHAQKLYLIDDKLAILRQAKKIIPSTFTIWVKRGIYAKIQKPFEDFTPDATVSNLKKVVSIIRE